MKNNKGITLVALVITIIVLLILAGVSISMVVGENGVLNRAKNATTETARAQAQEALEMAISGYQGTVTDKIATGVYKAGSSFYDSIDAGVINKEIEDGYSVSNIGTEKTVTQGTKTVYYKEVKVSNGTKDFTFFLVEGGAIGATVVNSEPKASS